MKRILSVFLLSLCFLTTVSADLSIVWHNTYDDLSARDYLGVVPLASGEFLCFYGFYAAPDDPNLLHAARFDKDGTILDDDTFCSTSLYYSRYSGVCPSVDGGAIAAILTGEQEARLYKWDAYGTLVDSTSFVVDEDCHLYDAIQNPDGSIILAGDRPDLISIATDLSVNWFRNFYDPLNETFCTQLYRRNAGIYGGLVKTYLASGDEHHLHMFTADGFFRHSYDAADYNDLTPSPVDDGLLCTYNRIGHSNPCKLNKFGYWYVELPNDPNQTERYNTVEPFHGISGYLCAGYQYFVSQDPVAIFVDVSESGVIRDTLEVDRYKPYHAESMMNGEMIVAGRGDDLGLEYDALGLFRISSGLSHAPIMAKLWLHDAPRRLSSNGGVLHYRLLIGNDLDDPADVTLKLVLKHIDHPELVAYESVRTLQPHEPVVIPHDQLAIPSGYPAGEYELTLRLYDENDVLCSSSMQLFTKADAGFGNTLVDDEPADPVRDYALGAIYPNPFNAATTINVTLPQASELSVRVFDIQGRTVATLADGASIAAGSNSFSFDGSDLSSGIYFVQATVPGQFNEVRKLVLVK